MTSQTRSRIARFSAAATCALGVAAIWASGAMAATNLGTFDYWTAWSDEGTNGTICYVSSTPQSSEPTNVNRGAIHFIVTNRPEKKNEVSTLIGYPFNESDAQASVSVDGQSFPMVTEDSAAWLASVDDEPVFVDAMKAGVTMIVRGTSSRGTDTVDTYSLIGVTDALDEINSECP